MDFDDLAPAEEQVRRAYSRGETVDFRAAEGEDPGAGADWGPKRTIRASVLKALLVSTPQEDGQIAALRIRGARVTGTPNLASG
jgi:hypothetical protein